jgi:hypothetical protein
MRVTFRPSVEVEGASDTMIVALIVDDANRGVEIRILANGEVHSHALATSSAAAVVSLYRDSPMWEEVIDDAP